MDPIDFWEAVTVTWSEIFGDYFPLFAIFIGSIIAIWALLGIIRGFKHATKSVFRKR